MKTIWIVVCMLILSTTFFVNCTILRHSDNQRPVWDIGDDIGEGCLDDQEDVETTIASMKAFFDRVQRTGMYGFKTEPDSCEYTYYREVGILQSIPIATIDRQLYQHDGRIYDKDSGRIASYCNIGLDFGDSTYYLARLNESGILETFQYGWKNYSSATIYANCDSLGNITKIRDGVGGDPRIEEFKNGKGWWYDYYIFPPPEGERVLDLGTFLVANFTTKIKSKGRLKNNFKVGRWKYYDPRGRLIRRERFRLRDSVDIRFPYSVIPKK